MIDIRGGVATFNYYESIMDNTVRVNVNIVDGGIEVGKSDSAS